MEIKTTSARQTQKIASDFAKTLKAGDIIALFGDLGAGKTIFAKGIARGLGIKKRIISPTYVFMRSYSFSKKKQKLTFYHIDLYRGKALGDFEALGLTEIFNEDSIVVLEWADRIKENLPKGRFDVFINIENDKTRKIKIKRN